MFEGGDPVLHDKRKFPDSSFSASASFEGHSAFDARISSGSSWCAPRSPGRHYLQVDFGKSFLLQFIVTFGDRTSQKWVASYNLNHTDDLVHWKTISSQLVRKQDVLYYQ